MKKILNEWKNYLFEAKKHYEIDLLIKAEADARIYGAIFNDIRAIPGVTIIKTNKRITKDHRGNKIVNLNLKFLMEPGLGGDYLKFLKNELQKAKDMEGDRILSVRITKFPIKVN